MSGRAALPRPQFIKIHKLLGSCDRSRVGSLSTIMAKQNTITAKQMNAGWNAVVKETHTLNQVLKTFGGICSQKLPELEGLTIGQFLTENGIKVTKGKVTVSAIRNAWNEGMLVDNKLSVFRYVPALWTPKEGESLWEKNTRAFRVFSKEQAEK